MYFCFLHYNRELFYKVNLSFSAKLHNAAGSNFVSLK